MSDSVSANPADPPLVSVVLPTYNRAPILGHAIRSVLDQTCRDFELIVVDDKSKDHTGDVVGSFDDARIRYVRNEENLKLPRGLNKGFSLSRGRFLTWTSDDNLYAPNALARMAAVLAQGTCDFVYADYFHFTDLDEASGTPLDTQRINLPPVPRLEERNSIGACFMYTRRVLETVGVYDPELFLIEDYDYFIRIQKRFRIRHIAEPLYYFRRHDDSLFCSRYAEVRAGDVLVRYKNGLLDSQKAANACIDLVMKDLGGLKNPMLRRVYALLKQRSYRLTRAYERAVRRYVAWKIGPRVFGVLDGFTSRAMTFQQAKDALREVMLGVGSVEYK